MSKVLLKVHYEESLASEIGFALTRFSFHPATSIFEVLPPSDLRGYRGPSIGILMGEEYGVMEGCRILSFQLRKDRRKVLGLITTEPTPRLEDVSPESWVFEIFHGEYMGEAHELAEALSNEFNASIRVRLITHRFPYEHLPGDGTF